MSKIVLILLQYSPHFWSVGINPKNLLFPTYFPFTHNENIIFRMKYLPNIILFADSLLLSFREAHVS